MFIAFFEARNDAGDDSRVRSEVRPSANVILITDAIYSKNQGAPQTLCVCVCVYRVDTNKDV